jgi:iron(III) transport system ATP-binding protein
MSVLQVRGLGKRFGATQALADVSFEVAPGSRTAIVGPSGSGKTTLLRLIAGFEAPDAGEIELSGERLADAAAGVLAHRRNIGLVMQEGALFPHLSVLENVRFGVRERPDGSARALELMDLVELDRGMADRQPHQLSGGQQQRVALARALARQPRLMLLDEPFSALDTGLRDQLRSATAQILARAGIATLLVTHDQDEAMSFADQLVILREGRLIQAGRPRDLYLSPADPITAAFLGPAIILDADIRDGVAQCALGAVPLAPTSRAAPGRAQILLRPEQLQLSTAPAESRADWRLTTVDHVGSIARVTIERAGEPGLLSFETIAHNLPAPDAAVSIAVAGQAWAFA